ncbi:DUF2187 family protein [Dolosicoccus paucivorans]|uniref:DUF2187 domain-containing protein n=1 Tax=Dolosicoccus paucivorans TaxID=84521 RepID=A0A1G8L072_9LACT|nr:DUF2187 family protein [Dolosicoccus paucivorans]PMB84041.1 DUF2187 domain-containing protein [Dolosicoccus paucivorans]PMC58619.1 DUF2187 domain-containing protein [Dolosicoccus paucivorans]SDI49135.1 hypothetical protein SAMN04487994_10162 [Dolosicoccus paucivorans]
MVKKVTKEQHELIEHELRRGTSRSRIATLLDVEYEEGVKMIEYVQESVRPEIGDKITFTFRDANMAGIITKLLTNSAVVEVYWSESDESMRDIVEDRTIVNFKDIVEFIKLPPQDEDEGLILDPQPDIITQGHDEE